MTKSDKSSETALATMATSDACVASLIECVGTRVREARKAQGMARRELSDRSGVSPRYLAKLESGDSNISIGLLQRVAMALDLPITHFLEQGDLEAGSFHHLAQLLRRADAASRARVLHLLDPERMQRQKAERICLVGLRGAGKSTLGSRIGRAFDVPFIELNEEIEKSAGMPLSEIIALYGQEGYRQLEADTLSEITRSHRRAVVAVAGGIVAEQDTFFNLLSRFHTIWLKTSAGEHMDRVRAQGDVRPMKGNPRAMIQLREILKSREAFYAQADQALDTSGKSVDVSVSELSELIVSSHMLSGAGN